MTIDRWLKEFLGEHGAIAGTVHVLDDASLTLRASVNIPPKVVEVTRTIPRGKGMAGLAWERDECVAICNLTTDETGDVRPGAKAVDAQAALAIPVRNDDGSLRAVVGIAFMGERDFTQEEQNAFERAASALPEA